MSLIEEKKIHRKKDRKIKQITMGVAAQITQEFFSPDTNPLASANA